MKKLLFLLVLLPLLGQSQSNRKIIFHQLNHVRIDPVAYGQSIDIDLSAYSPLTPLRLDPILNIRAQTLAKRQAGTYLQHSSWNYGECLSYGYGPQYVIESYIIDLDVESAIHRELLLSDYQRVGIGIYYSEEWNLWYSAILLE